MGAFNTILVIFFTVVQLVAVGLAISAVVTPLWMDPVKNNEILFAFNNNTQQVHHAGLWQLCYNTILSNSTDANGRFGFDELEDSSAFGKAFQGAYTSIGDEDCTDAGLEQFYRNQQIWGEDVWARVMVSRAMIIIFVICGFLKVFTVIREQCSEGSKGKGAWIGSIIFAILELASGGVVLAMLTTMLVSASDEAELEDRQSNGVVYDDFRDYSGANYWIFMVALILVLIPDISLCV